ncbi:hypothetical protein BDB00DRAFT_797415 [Zychaea mexicana]|uniref:uncharacterized protein n=1 Tax=Zychaea mexicana TaxID=64656 RepID=UPI0022FE8C47|nr:uncharacterized protein BDB00DRAFT_797415 [Zychaea mexicana]KAI9498936.1 hypothetical protein BDB00DRAFT_797415 [Zychaea mexicana]
MSVYIIYVDFNGLSLKDSSPPATHSGRDDGNTTDNGSAREMKKRMEKVEAEKGQIKPMQLSTVTTQKELQNLTTADLSNSIINIIRIRNPQVHSVRSSCLPYYNWVLVDLCRRMKLAEVRFQREFKEHYEEQLRRKIIMEAAEKVKWSIHAKNAFGITTDNEFFDLFAPFVPKKRERILRVADILGDEICCFTEFIDMKKIGDLTSDEFIAFYHDLLLCKERLLKALEQLTVKSSFHGDPTKSFNKVDLLNDGF